MKIHYHGLWFIEHAHAIDEWFDPNSFNWFYSEYLVIFCPEHFEKWWDPNKFNWTYKKLLFDNCLKYKDIWHDRFLLESIE